MQINLQLRYLWFVFAGGILVMSSVTGSHWIYQVVGANEVNRWIHFLAYLTVVAITFSAWKGRTGVLLSIVIAILGLGLELSPALIPGLIVSRQNVLADLFGVVGGTLLGFNIRKLRSLVKEQPEVVPSPSDSISSRAETTASEN